jgi:sec-independent protein translocase protein TatC
MALVPFPGSHSAERSSQSEPDPWAQSSRDDELEAAGARMSFLEHLDELRQRLIISVAAICVGCLVAFAFYDRIFDFIMRPLQRMLPTGSKLVYTEPMEAFLLNLKIALLAGIVLAVPVIVWQLWLFISPGLYRREKKFALPFIFLSSGFFVLGAAFSHYIVFPWMWVFFAGFSSDYVMFMPKIEPVFSLYTKMLLGMGLVFQLPAIVFFLAKMGLVTAGFLWRNFKYAILLIFIVAAVITPTGDPLTQTLFAAPMAGLYLISIFIAWMFGRRPSRRAAA